MGYFEKFILKALQNPKHHLPQ